MYSYIMNDDNYELKNAYDFKKGMVYTTFHSKIQVVHTTKLFLPKYLARDTFTRIIDNLTRLFNRALHISSIHTFEIIQARFKSYPIST